MADNKLTKYCALAMASTLGEIASGSTNADRKIEAALDGDFASASATATNTVGDVPLGTVDTSKIYQLFIQNMDPTSATLYLKVLLYDGTTTIEAGRLLPGDSMMVPAPPMSGGLPKYRVQTSAVGNVKYRYKVVEAGDPTL